MANTASKTWQLSSQKLSSNLVLKNQLEKAGHTVLLPQEIDQSDLKATFLREIEEIKTADAVVAVLSDTRGVYLEIGYAYAIGKPVHALKIEGTREMSAWGYNWFVSVSNNIEEVITSLAK